MSYDRRTLLKYMAGTSAAGLLAGCSSTDSNTTTQGGSGNGNVDTVTTLEFTTEEQDDSTPADGETTTEGCDYQNVEPESSGGTVQLWHARTEGGTNLLNDTKSIFNNNYDHTLVLSQIPNSNFQAKLQSAIPSGEGPHIFQWAHDLAGSFDQSEFLSDQSGNIRVDPCTYSETAWSASQYGDKVIGLPWAAETVALIYNKNLVDEPPETLEDMKAIMEEYHDPDAGSFGLGYPINPYYVSGFAQAYGEEIYNGEEDSLGVTSDGVKQGLRVILNDLKPYMPRDPGGGTQKSIFVNGNAPFTIDGPWQLPNFEDTDFDVGVTTLPDLPNGGTPRPYMGVKLFYFATKMDEEQGNGTAAREFSEWYTTSRRRILNLANNGGFVPVHSQLANDDRLPANVKGYAQQVSNGYPMPANPKMNQVWGPFGDAVTQAFNGNGNLDDLLATAEENIRNNWSDSGN